jgi:hypothetical protein
LGGGGYETNYDICGGGGTKQKMSGIPCLWLVKLQTFLEYTLKKI